MTLTVILGCNACLSTAVVQMPVVHDPDLNPPLRVEVEQAVAWASAHREPWVKDTL